MIPSVQNLEPSEWSRVKKIAQSRDDVASIYWRNSVAQATWKIIAELLRVKGMGSTRNHSATVTILAVGESECCAIVGPLSWYPRFGTSVEYLVVPYVTPRFELS